MTKARGITAIFMPIWLVVLVGFASATPEGGCEGTASPTPIPTEEGGLRLNEVMYDPASGPEWVEIVNASDTSMDLGGLLLTDDEGADTFEGSYRIPGGTVLAPGQLFTVGAAPWGGLDAVWGSDAPLLANAGDQVYLVRDDDLDGLFGPGDIVDAMSYSDAMGADGDGRSLVRTCLLCDGQQSTSWAPSSQWGGTPGAGNGSAPFVTPTPAPPTPIPLPAQGKRVLFDAGHCQRCGNADWVITGGYSDFADALRAQGFTVLSTTSDLVASNLSGFDLLVIPEPQDPFTSGEKDGILGFLAAGKGVMMIANHIDSDRNFSGWDSVEVFNGYKQGGQTPSTDWLANNIGIRFYEKDLNEEPLTDVRPHPAVIGVSAVGLYAGTTVEIVDASRATPLIFPERAESWGPMVVAVQPAMGGRVLAIGDSSPFDDGTCGCGDTLINNWSDWNHEELAISASLWLAKVN